MKSDVELASAFRRGNDAALHALVRRYHFPLFNFFLAVLEPAETNASAEALAQVSLLRLAHELSRSRTMPGRDRATHALPYATVEKSGAGSLRVYIFRHAVQVWNEARDKRASGLPALPLTVSTSEMPPAADAATSAALALPPEARAAGSPPERPYAALPSDLRVVVALKEACGLGYVECAAVLSVARAEAAHRVATAFDMLTQWSRSREQLHGNKTPPATSSASNAAIPTSLPPPAGSDASPA